MTKFAFEDPAQRRQISAIDERFARLEGRLETTISHEGTLILPPAEDSAPTGSGTLWFANEAPDGWLLCDGSFVDRADFADLFAVIGTTYGSTGPNNFRLPDLRQRFPLGRASGGTGSTLGVTGGNINHSHDDGSLSVASHDHPAGSLSTDAHDHGAGSYVVDNHQHGASGTLNVPSGQGSHDHGVQVMKTSVQAGGGANVVEDVDGLTDLATLPTLDVSGLTSIQIASTGLTGNSGSSGAGVSGNTGAASPNVAGSTGNANPPFQVVNYIVKT